MDSFAYRGGQLYCEEVAIEEIIQAVGSPTYIYSSATLQAHLAAFKQAFSTLTPKICFSVKCCSNVHILKLLAQQGAGLDVVSGGELYRALLAGALPEHIVFAGVGKSEAEIEYAVQSGIFLINAESEEELWRVKRVAARLKQSVDVGIRINPDVFDPKTHAKTATGGRSSKFGIPLAEIERLFSVFKDDPDLKLIALHVHLGSPIYSEKIYVQALAKLETLINTLHTQGHRIEWLDFGGGFPAFYDNQLPADTLPTMATAICQQLSYLHQTGVKFIIEPGRAISANAGILLLGVEYVKQGWDRRIIVCNGGMNVLLRTALYEAHHCIWPTHIGTYEGSWHAVDEMVIARQQLALETVDIVGPICETGDVFSLSREMPEVQSGSHLALFSAGAYGMTMASQYNSRPRPAEILVTGDSYHIIRERETYEDLVHREI